MGKFVDLTGMTFGRLTVIRRAEDNQTNRSHGPRYLCVCSCHKRTEKVLLGYSLKNGTTRSCGCLRSESSTERGQARSKRKALGVTDDVLRGLYEEERLSSVAIAEMFSVSFQVVRDWLKDSGIEVRSRSHASKMSISERHGTPAEERRVKRHQSLAGVLQAAKPIDPLQMDTPDTRELLALLEEAQAVAERIDAARGRALPEDIRLQPGESRGTDLAESISYLALRVRGEVCGEVCETASQTKP
jgi:hypothetical protein